MRQFLYKKNNQLLQDLIKQANISNVEELSQIAGVSQWQLTRLRYGLLPKMQVETVSKIAVALKISVHQLLETFASDLPIPTSDLITRDTISDRQEDNSLALTSLKQEYERLQQQLEQQRESLTQQLQQESLQILESWLLQWPTATAAIKKNPQLPAARILPLIKPVEQLIEKWKLEPIASVGEEVAYNPQWHELIKGTAEPGDLVKVRYVGYKQGDKLLYRAKVSPVLGV
jgi:molecular chaperone GrpE (heat shock protein)/DNA-binding Xre family transcriptional regulator